MAWNTNLQITARAMSYSAVNDLAKAMKALEGKKIWYGRSRSKARSLLFFSVAFGSRLYRLKPRGTG